MPSVLAVGLDPAFADFTKFPNLTPELIRAYIDEQPYWELVSGNRSSSLP